MTNLNNTLQVKKKKLELGEELVQEKVKLVEEALKVKNLDRELLLIVLKVAKCLYIEGCPKEVLTQ